MVLLIIGAVVAGIGLILWISKGKKEGRSATLAVTETSDVKDVNELFESMRNTHGDGSFTHFVELKGTAHSDSPLSSELAKQACVYYSTKIEHEFKKLERKKNAQGEMEDNWVTRKEVVSENEQWANGFGVKDATGFIEIEPGKAEIELEQFHSEFEKADSTANSALSLKIGGISLGVGQKNPGIKSIGYKSVEKGIRMDTRLYVLGDANDRDGRLVVSKPITKDQPFIVSTRTEDEIQSSLGSAANGLKWGAYICWGCGAALAIAGLLKMMNIF